MKTNLKNKLKELGIRLTELSDYFNISRPTIYKYIEHYEEGKLDQINPLVRTVFVFIESKDVISKKEVVTYIINLLDRELVFNDHDLLLKEAYDKLKQSASIETLRFILNWLEHPEYVKFMEAYNRYETMVMSKGKIKRDMVESDFPYFTAIFSITNSDKKSKQRVDKIIKYIEDRRIEK